jgi:hypothetical protein
MKKAANNSVPDYTSTNTVCAKTKINNGDSLRCIADSDASTLWDSSNQSISHESNEEHSAASTLCDSSLDSNKDQSAASTIDAAILSISFFVVPIKSLSNKKLL